MAVEISSGIIKARWIRRGSQALFLSSFIILIYLTEFSFSSYKNVGEVALPSTWLNLFFNIDPLTGTLTGLSAWTMYSSLFLGFIIITGTIFIGRFFCGWICPLGTMNQMFSSFSSERLSRKGKRLIEANKYHKYQAWKYYLFFGLLGLAMVGSAQHGLFDPITITARSFGLVIIPALNAALTSIGNFFGNSELGVFQFIGQAIFFIGSGTIIFLKQPHFHGVFWLALTFTAIMLANRVFTRFWCRALCPLGAFLGIIGRWSIFGLQKDHDKCTDCGICNLNCQGGDDPHGGVPHRRVECHMCLNCQAVCPEDVLTFKFQANSDQYKSKPDLTTRRAVIASIAGIAALPVIRSGDDLSNPQPYIRPPGALLEEDFLKRCIKCGQCMKICPTNALQPTLLEAGWEGIFSPVLMAQIGYCEHYCTLCGEICPTGAIKKLKPETKFGRSGDPPLKIGSAFFDKGRCLPWASGTTCIVCEEWCPTSPKAIWLEEKEIVDRDGNKSTIKLPHVDLEKCTGCGACEYACPIKGKAGIYVTSAGETRDPEKSLLLRKQNS